MRPRHSFVIPVDGHHEALEQTLASLRTQGVPAEALLQPIGPPVPLPPADASAGDLSVRAGAARPEAWSALDAGLQQAAGDWISFLQPGDRLRPGALARLADLRGGPSLLSGRTVVLTNGQAGGLELPWPFRGHARYLAFWQDRSQTLPGPSTFWPRALVARLGGLSASDAAAPYFALMCRYTRAHAVRLVDEYLAETPRLDAFVTAPEAFRAHFEVSRRHWGPWFGWSHWRARLAWLKHGLRRSERARRHVARAGDFWLSGGTRARSAILALGLAPWTSLPRLLRGPLSEGLRGLLERVSSEDGELQVLGSRRPYADGWVGPRLWRRFRTNGRGGRVTVRGLHRHPHAASVPLQLELRIDGQLAARHTAKAPGPFEFSWTRPTSGRPLRCVELLAEPSFIPDEMLGGGDRRRLSFVLEALIVGR